MSKRTKAKKPSYWCARCGGTNVQHAMWVDVNTDEVHDAFGSWCNGDNSWCHDCGEHTQLLDHPPGTKRYRVQLAVIGLPAAVHTVDALTEHFAVQAAVCCHWGDDAIVDPGPLTVELPPSPERPLAVYRNDGDDDRRLGAVVGIEVIEQER